MTLYHVTTLDNIDGIKAYGITPTAREDLRYKREIIAPCVYGFDNLDDCKLFAADNFMDDYAVFTFDSDSARPDPEYDGGAWAVETRDNVIATFDGVYNVRYGKYDEKGMQ